MSFGIAGFDRSDGGDAREMFVDSLIDCEQRLWRSCRSVVGLVSAFFCQSVELVGWIVLREAGWWVVGGGECFTGVCSGG